MIDTEDELVICSLAVVIPESVLVASEISLDTLTGDVTSPTDKFERMGIVAMTNDSLFCDVAIVVGLELDVVASLLIATAVVLVVVVDISKEFELCDSALFCMDVDTAIVTLTSVAGTLTFTSVAVTGRTDVPGDDCSLLKRTVVLDVSPSNWLLPVTNAVGSVFNCVGEVVDEVVDEVVVDSN